MDQLVRNAIQSGKPGVRNLGGQAMGSSGLYAVPLDIVDSYLKSSCARCGCRITKCWTCSRCGDVRYCGRACQVASWKSVHKLYCQQHNEASVGKLCWDNLCDPANTFGQITVTMQEHEGLGQAMESAIGRVLMQHPHTTLRAPLSDLRSMAKLVSRRLQQRDPSRRYDDEEHAATGLLTIAAAISTLASEHADRALAVQTPLFRCVARYYLAHAPRLAATAEPRPEKKNDADDRVGVDDDDDDPSNPTPPEEEEPFDPFYLEQRQILDVPLLSATVNLIHPGVNASEELISKCMDATWDAIEACLLVFVNHHRETKEAKEKQQQEEPTTTAAVVAETTTPTTPSKGKKKKGGNNNKKKNKKKNPKPKKEEEDEEDLSPEERHRKHLRKAVLPNLRMLARNLAYVGAKPLNKKLYEKIPNIVAGDLLWGMDDFDHEAIQIWATTAQNMLETSPTTTTTSEPTSTEGEKKKNIPASIPEVGSTILKVLQTYAPVKLGGTPIVFRDGPMAPGCTKPLPEQREKRASRRPPRRRGETSHQYAERVEEFVGLGILK